MQLGFEVIGSFLGQLLGLQGMTKEQGILDKIMSAYRAGKNVDIHMQSIADKLEAGDPIDWDELSAKLDTEEDEFLSRGEDGKVD